MSSIRLQFAAFLFLSTPSAFAATQAEAMATCLQQLNNIIGFTGTTGTSINGRFISKTNSELGDRSSGGGISLGRFSIIRKTPTDKSFHILTEKTIKQCTLPPSEGNIYRIDGVHVALMFKPDGRFDDFNTPVSTWPEHLTLQRRIEGLAVNAQCRDLLDDQSRKVAFDMMAEIINLVPDFRAQHATRSNQGTQGFFLETATRALKYCSEEVPEVRVLAEERIAQLQTPAVARDQGVPARF